MYKQQIPAFAGMTHACPWPAGFALFKKRIGPGDEARNGCFKKIASPYALSVFKAQLFHLLIKGGSVDA